MVCLETNKLVYIESDVFSEILTSGSIEVDAKFIKIRPEKSNFMFGLDELI